MNIYILVSWKDQNLDWFHQPKLQKELNQS